MANVLTLNPLKIDTASGTAAVTTPIRIRKIRWIGATTAGHTATIQDQNGNLFWTSVANAANYVEDCNFIVYDNQHGPVLNGLTVPTLGSGVLYIYT